MPATTPTGIPYPLPADPVADYPGVGLDLAETLEGRIAPKVTVNPAGPPANPVDGQLWIAPGLDAHLPGDGVGSGPVTWTFRYNAAVAQWEFAGGAPLWAYAYALQTCPGGGAATPLNPKIAVPFAGDYIEEASAWGLLAGAVSDVSLNVNGFVGATLATISEVPAGKWWGLGGTYFGHEDVGELVHPVVSHSGAQKTDVYWVSLKVTPLRLPGQLGARDAGLAGPFEGTPPDVPAL